MRVSNQSTTTVNWTQGNDPQPETPAPDSKSGTLGPGKETKPFPPGGSAPYTVTFSTDSQSVTSCPFSDADATVTLNDNWTVTVSTGCD